MSAPLLVADSGPLIALARVSLLHVPVRLYGQVFVPAAVWKEVLRRPSELELGNLQAALAAGHLTLAADAADSPLLPPPSSALGAGERAAIAMARECGAEVLIDERRGRRVALGAGLQVVGTLGLLVRARELGMVGLLRPTIATLRDSGYHLADALTERILASIGE